MAVVRILGSSKIRALHNNALLPDSTTRLLSFDVGWIPVQPVKTVLLYPDAAISPTSFDLFKSSLSIILPEFYPLAGDLTYHPATGEVAIVCSDESGVTVTEAESDLDICHLASDPTHDMDSFLKLAPNIVHEGLPVLILSVQFTRFSCGGVAVGISLNHVAMDAWGKWKFIDSWAKTCCDGAVPSGLNLLHDRAVVKFPNIDLLTNKILMKVAPNLPKIDPISKDPSPDQKQLIHRSFTVDATTIQLLKQRAMQEIGATHNFSPPNTFAVLAAHIWIAIARAKGITSNNDKPTFLISLLDGRPLLPPPMSPSYTGNCSFSYAVASSGTGLMCTNGLGRTCECIAETICTTREDVKRGNVMDLDSLNGLKVFLVGSNRLDVYGVDFGWGKSSLMVHASMNYDGEVVMVAGKEKGTVQLTVGLNYEAMDDFVHAFSKGLNLASNL